MNIHEFQAKQLFAQFGIRFLGAKPSRRRVPRKSGPLRLMPRSTSSKHKSTPEDAAKPVESRSQKRETKCRPWLKNFWAKCW